MKRPIVLTVAAVLSFGATLYYLHQQRQPVPTPAPSEPAPPELPAAIVPPPQPPAAAPPAPDTGYPETPKASVTAVSVPATPEPEQDDAAIERRQLAEYAGGISNVAPVSPEQQRAILEAKLRHRKTYETVLRDSGINRETLTSAERAYAHQTITRALNDYKEGFLLDVKPVLTDEQFTLLRDYETTEFARELERLQITINSK